MIASELANAPVRLAQMALERLMVCQRSSGLITYESNVESGYQSNRKYNMVRLAGVFYSLCWAAEFFGTSTEFGGRVYRAAQATQRFLQFSAELGEGCFVRDYSEDQGFIQNGKLGATALTALGLTFAPFRTEQRMFLNSLLTSIRSARQRSGMFQCNFTDPSDLSNQRYASGEAVLALVRFAQVTQQPELLAELRPTFDFYVRYYEHDPHPGFLMWHIDSWSRAAGFQALPVSDRTAYSQFAEQLAQELLSRQCLQADENRGGIAFGKRPGISTSLYVESLIRVAGMLERQGRDGSLYRQAALEGFRFVSQLQVTSSEAQLLTHPERFAGGMRMSKGSPVLRMDNDQHAITCCLAFAEEGVEIHQLETEATTTLA